MCSAYILNRVGCMRVVNVLCVGKYVVMYGLAFAFVRSTFVVAALMRARELAFVCENAADWFSRIRISSIGIGFVNTHSLRT